MLLPMDLKPLPIILSAMLTPGITPVTLSMTCPVVLKTLLHSLATLYVFWCDFHDESCDDLELLFTTLQRILGTFYLALVAFDIAVVSDSMVYLLLTV